MKIWSFHFNEFINTQCEYHELYTMRFVQVNKWVYIVLDVLFNMNFIPIGLTCNWVNLDLKYIGYLEYIDLNYKYC